MSRASPLAWIESAGREPGVRWASETAALIEVQQWPKPGSACGGPAADNAAHELDGRSNPVVPWLIAPPR